MIRWSGSSFGSSAPGGKCWASVAPMAAIAVTKPSVGTPCADGFGELVDDRFPRSGRHHRVDALVGDDLRVALGHGHEQQHPRAPRGGVQVLHEELLDGAALRMQVLDAGGHQGHADRGRHVARR